MKRLLIILTISLLTLPSMSQVLEFNLRGGINMDRSSVEGKDLSFLPHLGAMAGARFSSIGIYAEMLLTIHDGEGWAERGTYLVPSLVVRYYNPRIFYLEAGPSYYLLTEKQVPGADVLFPDKKIGFLAGAGFYAGRFDIGVRGVLPVKSLQLTITYIF